MAHDRLRKESLSMSPLNFDGDDSGLAEGISRLPRQSSERKTVGRKPSLRSDTPTSPAGGILHRAQLSTRKVSISEQAPYSPGDPNHTDVTPRSATTTETWNITEAAEGETTSSDDDRMSNGSNGSPKNGDVRNHAGVKIDNDLSSNGKRDSNGSTVSNGSIHGSGKGMSNMSRRSYIDMSSSFLILDPKRQTPRTYEEKVVLYRRRFHFEVICRFLGYSQGRSKLLMVMQYAAEFVKEAFRNLGFFLALSGRVQNLEDNLSEGRKAFRWFRFLEDYRRLLETLRSDKPWRELAVFAQICSLFYLFFDHINWLGKAKILDLSPDVKSFAKEWKNHSSVSRIVIDMWLDYVSHRVRLHDLLKSSMEAEDRLAKVRKMETDLMFKELENLCMFFLAARAVKIPAWLRAAGGIYGAYLSSRRLYAKCRTEVEKQGRFVPAPDLRKYPTESMD
eukprot:Clim_evm73s22 gene=Clim_evmTU73s22